MPIHQTARIDPSAEVASSAQIGPNVEIGPGCVVGEDCELMSGVILGPRVKMGARNRVHSYAVLGEEPQFLGFDPATPSGLIIGDDNEFREMSSVHRGLKPDSMTTIGSGNFVMVHAHVAHDCHIGNNVVLANSALLAGHVEVGDRAFISGHAAIHQFCRIGKLAMIGGLAAVNQDIAPFVTCRENPARLVSLNVIGMRRAGISSDVRLELKRAYRSLFMSGLLPHNAAQGVFDRFESEEVPVPTEVNEFLEFCKVKSKRGITTKLLRGAFEPSGDSSE